MAEVPLNSLGSRMSQLSTGCHFWSYVTPSTRTKCQMTKQMRMTHQMRMAPWMMTTRQEGKGTSIFLEVGWTPKIKWVIFRFHLNFSGCTLGYKTSRRIPLITRIVISIALVRDPFSDLYFPHFTARGSMPKYIDNWKHNDSCPFLGGTTRSFF